MKSLRNKIVAIAISVFFILSMTVAVSQMQTASAHYVNGVYTGQWNIPTYAYTICAPDVVGVGQYTQILMWLNQYPVTAGGLGGDRWHGYMLNITQPDGTMVQLGPFSTDQVGNQYTIFTPTQVGNYTIVFYWPGQILTNGTGIPNTSGVASVGDYYEPSQSAPYTLYVLSSPIASWQEPPIPTGYWTLPVTDENRYWSPILSNYPGGSWFRYSSFQEEGAGPTTAHVLWANPLAPGYAGEGGILDARYAGIPEDVNDYESWLGSPIILDGKLYYNSPQVAESQKYGYYCLNLYTGQEIWYKNGTDNGLNNPVVNQIYSGLGGAGVYSGETFPTLSFGQLLDATNVNGQGVVPYLWMTEGSTDYMLDAATGDVICSVVSWPGVNFVDQFGDLCDMTYNSATGQFLCWNSSQAIYPASPIGTGQQQWKPAIGGVYNAVNDTTWLKWGLYQDFDAADIAPHSGYTLNYTSSALVGLPGITKVLQGAAKTSTTGVSGYQGGLTNNQAPQEIFMSSTGGSTDQTPMQFALVKILQNGAYSPYPLETNTQNNNLGFSISLVYNITVAKPYTSGNYSYSVGAIDYEDGVFTLSCVITRQYWGFNLNTGAMMWGPTAQISQWGYYGLTSLYCYGELIASSGYGGQVIGYNITTGAKLWEYDLTEVGYESPYGALPASSFLICDGMIYIYSTEHSPTKPLWRGSYARCINATTGQEIWKLQDFVTGWGIADGYLVTCNQYDNLIYCIGIGPSATTVSAPSDGIPMGSSFTIKGYVTDQSPGALSVATKMGYGPTGVPAVSDASQPYFMQYLYESQAYATNTTGVPVTLTAVDPNNNTVSLGTVTTDPTSGMFRFDANTNMFGAGAGQYTIYANFAGSGSYGASSASAAFAINAAAAPTAAPTATPTSIANMYFVPAIAGLFVVIIVVAIVLALLMLRKKP